MDRLGEGVATYGDQGKRKPQNTRMRRLGFADFQKAIGTIALWTYHAETSG